MSRIFLRRPLNRVPSAVFGSMLLLFAVMWQAEPSFAATYAGNPACNYSSGISYEAISVACQNGTALTQINSNITVPSASISNLSDELYANIEAWQGAPCTEGAGGGAIYFSINGTTSGEGWYDFWGVDTKPWEDGVVLVRNSSGQNIKKSPGNVIDVDVYSTSNTQGYIITDGYIYGTPLAGYDFCIATGGSSVISPNAGLNTVSLGTSTISPLDYWDTSYQQHSGYNYYYISLPCGQGNSSPYCFNGAYYASNTEWQSNKP